MHMSLTCKSESTCSAPSILDDMIKQQRHVSHISWSPWISRRGCYRSIIVYATNEDVRARIATYKNSRLSLGDEVLYPNIEMRYYGPLKWCPIVDDDVLTLALFTASGLICLTLSTDDASIIKRATHNLDGRWDQISGAVWDVANRPATRLHFSSLLSTIRTPTSVLEASPDTLTLHGIPSWREQIENSASLFSAKNDLKGNTKTKVWGLATSPLGDFIASCHSVHPSDMIEYGSPNDRRGTVAVSGLRNYREMRQSFPAHDLSAEGMLFTLKKLVENTVEDSEQIPNFIEEIAEKLFLAYGSIQVSGNEIGPSLPPSETKGVNVLEMLTQDLKRAVLFDPHTLRDRYTILASYACNKSSANDLQRTLIAYRLAAALRDISIPFPKSLFSAEIFTHHEKLRVLIQNIMEHDGLDLRFADTSIDTCDFCSAPIPFTDLITAACTNGHQFPRCGLSFLAIQAPGITKYCGICSTPFLNEEFVDVQEKNSHLRCVEEQDQNTDVNLPERGTVAYLEANDKGSNQSDGNGDASTRAQPSSDREDQLNCADRDRSGGKESWNLATEEEQRDTTVTLARVLFLACDVCIYCGGKFVG
jgi:hypothetical protein